MSRGAAGARVAVIEDDPEIGPMLGKILEMDGFQVALIRDGISAVGALRSGGFRAAVLDIMLPGKDGISVLREIRGIAETARLPVIMLTAKTDDATTWEGWRAGASYFMTKPFDPDELVAVLRSALEPP
jgi:DNA-binding response OmpR family regulator